MRLLSLLVMAVGMAGCTTMQPGSPFFGGDRQPPIQNPRQLQVTVSGDTPGLEAVIYAGEGDQRRRIPLGRLPIDREVSVPSGAPLELGITNYETVRSAVLPDESFDIAPDQQIFGQEVQLVLVEPLLEKQYAELDVDTRRSLIRVVAAYDVALNSPRMHFSAKLAEAKGELAVLRAEAPDFRGSRMDQYLHDLQFYMSLSAASESLHGSVIPRIGVLQRVVGI